MNLNYCRWMLNIWCQKSRKIYDCPDLNRGAIVPISLAPNPIPSHPHAIRVRRSDRVGVMTSKPMTTRMKCCRCCYEKVVLSKKPSADCKLAYLLSKGIIMNLMKSLPGALSLGYVKTFTVIHTLSIYIWFLFVKLLLGCK